MGHIPEENSKSVGAPSAGLDSWWSHSFYKNPSFFQSVSYLLLVCLKTFTAFVTWIQKPRNGAWKTWLDVKSGSYLWCAVTSREVKWWLRNVHLFPEFWNTKNFNILNCFLILFPTASRRAMSRRSKSEKNLLLDVCASECFQIQSPIQPII